MLEKIRKNIKGQSLIEMLLALTIFTVVVIMAVGIFQGVIAGQRVAISAQNTQESMRYATEVISKEIRSAKKTDGNCPVSPSNNVYNTNGPKTELYLINKDNQCVKYYINNNQLYIDRDGTFLAITPNEILISNIKFEIVDNTLPLVIPITVQPKVTIRMDVESITIKNENKQRMTIQTTISSRHYE